MKNDSSRFWLLALVSVIGCGAAPEPAVKGPEVQNVIIVLVDTLRADHLGTYGHERDTSPRIDAAISLTRMGRGSAIPYLKAKADELEKTGGRNARGRVAFIRRLVEDFEKKQKK